MGSTGSTESWAGGVAAITLFTEDLETTTQFYVDVFQAKAVFEDESSAAFSFGPTIVNLLLVTSAPELVQPAAVGAPDAGPRAVYTVEVDDVDAVCAELASRGVALLNGPMDRPWGIRTASFRDPAGHVWEIAR